MSTETVKIIKDQGGRYILPAKSIVFLTGSSSYQNISRTVNGIELPQPTHNRGPVQIPFPTEIKVTITTKTKAGYRDDKNDKAISVEQYDALLNKITSKGGYEEYRWEFDNIDDEYEYKKFTQTWQPVYEDVKEEIVFTDFDIVDEIVSEFEYIRPVCSIVNNPDEMLFILTPTPMLILTEVAEKLGYRFIADNSYGRLGEKEKLKTISVSNHSGYQYTKINGNYINDEETRKFNSIREFRGSYAECLQEKERQVKLAYEILKPYDDRLNQKKVDQVTVGELLSYLSNLKNRVGALDVKKTNYSTQRGILGSIQTKIDELTNA
jgi:hypothetical protein